jgi:hypothetical protein
MATQSHTTIQKKLEITEKYDTQKQSEKYQDSLLKNKNTKNKYESEEINKYTRLRIGPWQAAKGVAPPYW